MVDRAFIKFGFIQLNPIDLIALKTKFKLGFLFFKDHQGTVIINT